MATLGQQTPDSHLQRVTSPKHSGTNNWPFALSCRGTTPNRTSQQELEVPRLIVQVSRGSRVNGKVHQGSCHNCKIPQDSRSNSIVPHTLSTVSHTFRTMGKIPIDAVTRNSNWTSLSTYHLISSGKVPRGSQPPAERSPEIPGLTYKVERVGDARYQKLKSFTSPNLLAKGIKLHIDGSNSF